MEEFLRPQSLQDAKSLTFQILSWEAFDEEVENKRGKLVINQDIKIFIYNKSQYLKQVSVKEFINLEMDLAE